MSEGGKTRLVAWGRELRAVHERLREALRITQAALDDGVEPQPATRDLLLFCHGFCTALTGHHAGEDRELFPTIADEHPELRETIRALSQDHSMIQHLVGGLHKAVDSAAPSAELAGHLEGIAAIMESHFRFEERRLLPVLDSHSSSTLTPLMCWVRCESASPSSIRANNVSSRHQGESALGGPGAN